MKKEGKVIVAEEGMLLRRKSDNMVFGDRAQLGMTWYIGGERLEVPHEEVPEDFEEVTQEQIDEEVRRAYGERVDALIRVRYTLSEELALLRQRDEKPDEYQAYYDYCEECKQRAR